jgi:hypothetical protein
MGDKGRFEEIMEFLKKLHTTKELLRIVPKP